MNNGYTMLWEEPDPVDNTKELFSEDALKALMDNPGKWAVVRMGTRSAVASYGNRCRKQYAKRGFEFTTRSNSATDAKLYARYVGGS